MLSLLASLPTLFAFVLSLVIAIATMVALVEVPH